MLGKLTGAINGAAYSVAVGLGLGRIRAAADGAMGPRWKAAYWSLAEKKTYSGVVLAALTVGLLAFGHAEAAAGLGSFAALLVQAGILDKAWRTDRPSWLSQSALYRWLAARSSGLASVLTTLLMALQIPAVAAWHEPYMSSLQASTTVIALAAVLVQLGLLEATWRAAPPLIPLVPLAPGETLPDYVQRDGPTVPGIPGQTVVVEAHRDSLVRDELAPATPAEAAFMRRTGRTLKEIR